MTARRFAAPLPVVVTWDDACSHHVDGLTWDGTYDAAAKIAKDYPLYRQRRTAGYLIYLNEEALWLAHDWDHEPREVGNLTVIPSPWIEEVRMNRRVLFTRKL